MPRQHWVIPIANKIGFHPSARQASKINCLATAKMLQRHAGEPPSSTLFSTIDGDEFNEEFLGDVQSATREVMAEAKPSPRRMHGIPRGRIITIGANGIEHVQANNQ